MSQYEAQYSNLPEAYAYPNETLEVVRKSEDKEVVRGRDDYAPEPYFVPAASENKRGSPSAHQHITRKRLLLCGLLVLIALALALGLGLGLGLGHHKTSMSSTDNGQGTHQSNVASHGVLFGTDTASIQAISMDRDGFLHDEDDLDYLLLFYQHASGDIRWMQKSGVDSYYGGTADISRNNTVRQRICSGSSTEWYSGPLDDLKYTALDGSGTALKVGRYTGQIANTNLSNVDTLECARLFVGITETTIGQLAWCPGIDWQVEKTWTNVNGRSSPAFLGYLPGKTTYAAFTDLDNNAQLYWEDTQEGAANTARHPINQWTLVTEVTISNIDPSGGLAALSNETLLARKLDGDTIQDWNVTLAAENSTAVSGWTFANDQRTLPGSQFKVVLTPGNDLVEMRLVYLTMDGNITMSSRSRLDSGTWETTVWPIPDD